MKITQTPLVKTMPNKRILSTEVISGRESDLISLQRVTCQIFLPCQTKAVAPSKRVTKQACSEICLL